MGTIVHRRVAVKTQFRGLHAVYAKWLDAMGKVVTLAQRYKPKAFLRSWQPFGNPAVVPNEGDF